MEMADLYVVLHALQEMKLYFLFSLLFKSAVRDLEGFDFWVGVWLITP